MTKLDEVMERARALPADQQDALADQVALWLVEPDWPEPEDQTETVGSDAELARRVAAWEANPVGTPAHVLHAELKARHQRP